MASFDIVSKYDAQEVDNAVNNTRKEVENRYDFRGLHTEITFDRKGGTIRLVAADRMKLNAVKEMLTRHAVKRGLEPGIFDFQRSESTSMGQVKMDVPLKEGISKDQAKAIVKEIKSLKLKVQPAIQQDQVRVTAKKIDDLQSVIKHLKTTKLDLPLQFVNMR